MKRKRILLGVSGGVDSAVSAYLLKKEGYEVIGVHLVVAGIGDRDARRVCEFLNIEYIEINLIKKFNDVVINYFLEGYSKGITPSPCIICDEKIKFKTLFSLIKSEDDFIATGHYAYPESYRGSNIKLFRKIENYIKDQSYMLYRLNSKIIEKCIFPLSKLKKDEVREIAKEIKLFNFSKPDSQNLCFAKSGYRDFLNEKLKNKKNGQILDIKGNIIGTHLGYQEYTIGQRRRLNLKNSEPKFVINILPEKNQIIVDDYKYLQQNEIKLQNCVFHIDENEILNNEIIGRPRSSSKGKLGILKKINNEFIFKYDEENAENSLGQHLVFYTKDGFLLGGGIIKGGTNATV